MNRQSAKEVLAGLKRNHPSWFLEKEAKEKAEVLKVFGGPKIKILCVLVSLGGFEETLKSIRSQTVQPAKIVIADKPYPEFKFVGERAGMAVRKVLKNEPLNKYSHFLRVDGDVFLPPTFIEESVKLGADLVGWGYAQLMTISSFLELFGGVYPVFFAEDSVLVQKIRYSCKHSFAQYVVKPILPQATKYRREKYVETGKACYMLGFSLFHVMVFFKNRRSRTLVGFNVVYVVAGWLLFFVRHAPKFDFANKKNRAHSRLRDWI